MKVIQINCVYKEGSTGKIVADIHQGLLQQGYESVVCYGRRRKKSEKDIYKVSSEMEAKIHSICSRLFGVDFEYSPIATNRLINIINKEKPDVVHLHCLNGHFVNAYRLIEYLKSEKIHTILTLHAEMMHTAGCEHSLECNKWMTECFECKRIKGIMSRYFRDDARHCYRKMRQAFAEFNNLTVIGVSEWLTARAIQSPIFKGKKFQTILNGINVNTFLYQDRLETRRKMNISDREKIVLHVTPDFNHPIKGGKYVIELAKLLPDYKFYIIGFNGNNKDLPSNIVTISHTKNQSELARYYALADVTLLTSKRETFSMVCAESLACGTPVVGFKSGGPETIALPQCSAFVEFGDVVSLKAQVEYFANISMDREETSTEAQNKYSSEKMAQEYIQCYLLYVQ